MHQNDKPECPSCKDKLATAHPLMVEWFGHVKMKFPEAHISCAFRNKYEQDYAYMHGKSQKIFPLSKHNYITSTGKPCSLALDLFKMEGKTAFFDKEWYAKIYEVTKEGPINIRWGGDFSFKDYNHYEINIPEEERDYGIKKTVAE